MGHKKESVTHLERHLILHLVGYVITNLAVFVCVIAFYNWTGKEEIADFAGLAEKAPFAALTMRNRMRARSKRVARWMPRKAAP